VTQVAELAIVQPLEPSPVPAAVSRVAQGRPFRQVWINELGGLTYEISDANTRFFVKFAPAGSGLPLRQEADRLRWAARFTPVPRVVGEGEDHTGFWLVTEALPGRSAVDPYWKKYPEKAVKAIAYGMKKLHETLPLDDCPFDWSIERRLAAGFRDLSGAHSIHRDLTLDEARRRAATPPPIDKPVVCHGDPCAPNTLIGDDGRWSGHVDLAALGAADRWADLAVGSWSLSWNYGPGWETLFFDTYGIAPDPDRIAYYRLLWDLGS
jgi:kanamycin kinase